MQAGGMYFLVQFVKMLLLATFFPETESESLDIVGVRCNIIKIIYKHDCI